MKRTLVLTLAGTLAVAGLFGLALSDRFAEYIGTTFGDAFFSEQFALGKILSIQEEAISEFEFEYLVQTIQVRFLTGPNAGQETEFRNEGALVTSLRNKLDSGEVIVVGKSISFDGDPYYLSDRFRLPVLLVVIMVFFLAVILVARWRGLTALLGLGVSALILLGFILPRVIQGGSPFLTLLAGTFMIAVASLYLAHGINKRTSIAVIGTLITLVLAMSVATLSVYLAKIAGIGSEDAFYVKLNLLDLDLTGLLLGGILIGALGVLDDITIGQAATVEQIRRANPKLTAKDLFARGMAVGREHIASLVNTLVLAYAGASLPLIMLFVINQGVVPYWSIVNGEPMAEEIVRTVVGSLALVLAVPITTLLAAFVFGMDSRVEKEYN